MVDIRRFLPRRLNDEALELLGGSYTGTLTHVVVREQWNRYAKERQLQPVMIFEDGWRLVPNDGMRADLAKALGSETDAWAGAVLRVERQRRAIPFKAGTRSVLCKVVSVVQLPRVMEGTSADVSPDAEPVAIAPADDPAPASADVPPATADRREEGACVGVHAPDSRDDVPLMTSKEIEWSTK